MPEPKFQVTIQFVADAFDRVEIESAVRRLWLGKNVITKIEPNPSLFVPPEDDPDPTTGAGAMLTIAREKGTVRWNDIKGVANAQGALKILLAAGRLRRIRKGIYTAGFDSAESDAALIRDTDLGPRQKQILAALDEPRTTRELQLLGGTSKQVVHNALQRLIRAGMVKRLLPTESISEIRYIARGLRSAQQGD